ncbi:MAG: undecaprenyl-diphosphate phosphatase [Bacteroidales bacterium]|nr:undecaprenyl-diphosphate phosphatase [Bacteroidales bacterium]
MNWFEAFVLGLIQGLTEFLPVSSSGHLELGKYLFGINNETNFYFSVAVHGATVLSTILVLWKEIRDLFKGFFKFRLNEETEYVFKIFISMIPVGITGFFLNDIIEGYFAGNMISLGIQFIITAVLLLMPLFIKPKERQIGYIDSFIIGIAQAIAVLPAISRSGATIATGMMLGNKKSDIAKFSFLMVLIPIIGANLVEMKSGDFSTEGTSVFIILIGFVTAFVSGYYACKWMINLVKKGNLTWFAVYCVLVGIFSILLGLHVI